MSIKDLVPHIRKSANIERRTETLGVAPLQREINRLFDEFWTGWGIPELASDVTGEMPSIFDPRVNVIETEKEFKVTVELPGMDEKEVQITVDKDTLTIQGEKKEEKEDKEGPIERSYGSFQRMFRLPENSELDTAKARFVKGVLTVTLAKKPGEHKDRKTIKVEVA